MVRRLRESPVIGASFQRVAFELWQPLQSSIGSNVYRLIKRSTCHTIGHIWWTPTRHRSIQRWTNYFHEEWVLQGGPWNIFILIVWTDQTKFTATTLFRLLFELKFLWNPLLRCNKVTGNIKNNIRQSVKNSCKISKNCNATFQLLFLDHIASYLYKVESNPLTFGLAAIFTKDFLRWSHCLRASWRVTTINNVE